MIVDASARLSWGLETARANLREALDSDPGAEAQLRTVAHGLGLTKAEGDLDAVVEFVARAVANGTLVAVVVADEPVGRPFLQRRERDEDWSDAIPISSLLERDPDTGLWSVRVVLDDGAALAGETVRVTPPGGGERARGLDGAGLMTLDHVGAGTGRVRFVPTRAPRANGAAEGFVASPNSVLFPFGGSADLHVPAPGTHIVVLLRPSIDRIDPRSLRFARESSVLVPLDPTRSHLEAIAMAIAVCGERPTSALLVVGHSSADGDIESNTALALRRALCVRHLIDSDRDAWVALVAEHGTPADIQRMLAYLAQTHRWPTDPGRTDGVVDGAYSGAVAQFQDRYNAIYDADLDIDGVCGEVTIGALFDGQSYELHEHLATLGASSVAMRSFDPAAVGAGPRVLAHPALAESALAEGQRRVDLLLLEQSLAWREPHGIELLYDAARFRTLPVRPLAGGRADLVLRLVDHYGRVVRGAAYELVTDADRRTGYSDDDGLVVERGLAGERLQLYCGAVRSVPVDLAYQALGSARFARVAATDEPAEDDEPSEDDERSEDDEVDSARDQPEFDHEDDLNLDLEVEEHEGAESPDGGDDGAHTPDAGD